MVSLFGFWIFVGLMLGWWFVIWLLFLFTLCLVLNFGVLFSVCFDFDAGLICWAFLFGVFRGV